MLKVVLPDGSVKEFESCNPETRVTVYDVAAGIGAGLAKAAVAAVISSDACPCCAESKTVGVDFRLPESGTVHLRLLTKKDPEALDILRHSAAHIMARAVMRLYPGVQLAFGPNTDNGFYYDIHLEKHLGEEDFAKIEAEMAAIIKLDENFERLEVPKAEAIEMMESTGQTLKVEHLNEGLADQETVSFYRQGEFIDLCRGPHIPSPKHIGAVKLMSVAGAYWKGDANQQQLQRLYATAFFDKKDLDEYLFKLEEAKKRDHRKLGKELDLFGFHDEGPGFPFFYPKGMVLRNQLENYWRELHSKNGYSEIKTPIILNRDMWLQSGHWDHYKENMYGSEIDEINYQLKPMNCPGGMLIYNQEIHSYREFPLRMAELGLVHRHEKSGTLHGLVRVRCFTQDDAHIYMTENQLKDEIKNVIKLYEEVYANFGIKDFHFELSTRPENSMGTEEAWELATNYLREALEEMGRPYQINEGDGAFYGPKIDFHLKDSLGRSFQCGTIQCDMQLPEVFDLTYIGADGLKHRPVMIHRTCFGSVERFIAILTEHTAGRFPFWLTPVQIIVLPISEKHHEAASKIYGQIIAEDLRVEVDLRMEKIGFKIREAQLQRIPVMLVVGDKEIEENKVSVRTHENGDEGQQDLDGLIQKWKTMNKY